MKQWKITGLVATLAIILLIPVHVLKEAYFRQPSEPRPPATFVGSEKCSDCHKQEYDKWQGSHHDLAMDEANEKTVLADFDNAVFEHFGVTTRFYRKEGRFFAHTQGPAGEMGDFEVTYAFGVYPLQQYLVPFPGGRLQCLPMAWDVDKKAWFHLYPDDPIDPKDWLYWTNAGQNWNGMCAECHSTNLKKNYDIEANTYRTTWSEIDVSCEACHGPGSFHVAWAELPDMARPQTENAELVVDTSTFSSRDQVELCAPCHSRRAALGDYTHAEKDLLDSLLPSLLEEGLYFSDGQILEEVYVYGSFTQSKMYRRDVRCSDCHDVHSAKTIKQGNDLCLQCHRADVYDRKAHHFHKKKGEKGEPIKSADGKILYDVGTGAECVLCHMPGRTYMVIDNRADHSLRIPRPDMSIALGTPNACDLCHIDKTSKWSDEEMTKWYGPGRRFHYGTILDAGRRQRPEAQKSLMRLAADPLYPVIVRATALSSLAAYPSEESARAWELALLDEESLIRRTGVNHLHMADRKRQVSLLASMLYDPVKAVRMEAATRMAEIPNPPLDRRQQEVYQRVLLEYEEAMAYSGDFSFGRYNLGNLYANLGKLELAVENYEMATQIDDAFYPAKVNLAMLYNQMGRNDKAEALLREVVTVEPELHEVQYSLGLLLAEEKQYAEASEFLARAAKGMPGRARVHYNLGLVLQHLGKYGQAETALLKAHEIDPEAMDFLHALADHYIRTGNLSEGRRFAQQMVSKDPANPLGHELLRFIEERMKQTGS